MLLSARSLAPSDASGSWMQATDRTLLQGLWLWRTNQGEALTCFQLSDRKGALALRVRINGG